MAERMASIRSGALALAVAALVAGAGSAAEGAIHPPKGFDRARIHAEGNGTARPFTTHLAVTPSTRSTATRAVATLALRASLVISSSTASRRFGERCAPGNPASVECFDVRGSGAVRGLGRVSLSSIQFVDTAPPGCPTGSFGVVGAPMRLSVAGKGTIELRLDPATGCRTLATVLSHTRSYTVVGGTGAYSGATGSGTVRREAGFSGPGSAGTDFVAGTLTVPGLEFDVTPPRLSGALPRAVRAAQGANRARVTYKVAASDAADGRVPVKCTPPSGSQFRVGRTVVRCSATDRSGNTARARFTVSVRRAG